MDTYILYICIMLLKLIQNGFHTGHWGHHSLSYTHTHPRTQHQKYGCNIITPKTTDTLPINTSLTRVEGLDSEITCWSCWMEWKCAHSWYCWPYTALDALKLFSFLFFYKSQFARKTNIWTLSKWHHNESRLKYCCCILKNVKWLKGKWSDVTGID